MLEQKLQHTYTWQRGISTFLSVEYFYYYLNTTTPPELAVAV